MNTRFRTALAAVALALALLPLPSHAAQYAIDPQYFPKHSTITMVENATNGDVDCAWADCPSATPLFHSSPQDDLGRQSGWIEIGIRRKGGLIGFQIVSSLYIDGRPDTDQGSFAKAAFQDFADSDKQLGFKPMKRSPGILPPTLPTGMTGGQLTYKASDPDYTEYVFATWFGNREIEALAVCKTHKGHGDLVLQDLIAQVQEAAQLGVNEFSEGNP